MSARGALNRPAVVERWIQVAIMLAIGGAAGAGSFRHVHDVAAAHGQAGWLAWADAVVLELMSVASGLELRRRKRLHQSVRFPGAVMGISVVLSLGAQVVEAEPSPIGWIAAAIPALGFLVMVKIALAGSIASMDESDESPDGSAMESPLTDDEVEKASGEVDSLEEILVPAARAAAAALRVQRRRVTGSGFEDCSTGNRILIRLGDP